MKVSYSTENGNDLYDLGDIIFPVSPTNIDYRNNRYYFSYKFTQDVFVNADDKGWGLFGQIGVSDGNPNPINFGSLLGIGGNSFIKNRIDDKLGLAMYHYSLSKPIDDFSESTGVPLRNETGFELFYQAMLTKWLQLGGDMQYVIPTVRNNQNVLYLGLRTSILF